MKFRSPPFVLLTTMAAFALAAPGASAEPEKPAAPAAPAPQKPAAKGSDPAAEAIADRVQTFYDKTKTFEAEFQQRYTIEAYQRTKDSRGKVIFEKPGKMSWRYTNNGNRVVSDGKVLKVYEQENQQMYEQPVDKSYYPAALAFLIGGGDIKKSFNLTTLDPARAQFKGGYVLVGEPRDPTPAYQKILFYVDGKTAQVRRILLIDAQGNRNRFDFSKPVVNKKAAPGEFQFTPPKGTKIVKP